MLTDIPILLYMYTSQYKYQIIQATRYINTMEKQHSTIDWVSVQHCSVLCKVNHTKILICIILKHTHIHTGEKQAERERERDRERQRETETERDRVGDREAVLKRLRDMT